MTCDNVAVGAIHLELSVFSKDYVDEEAKGRARQAVAPFGVHHRRHTLQRRLRQPRRPHGGLRARHGWGVSGGVRLQVRSEIECCSQ